METNSNKKNRPQTHGTLSEVNADNLHKIGGKKNKDKNDGSISLHGEISTNKPEIPKVIIRFFTKAAPKLLASNNNSRVRGGRDLPFTPGLDWFDTKLTKLLSGIKNDDPFADQMLLNIEQEIQIVGEFYKTEQARLLSILNNKMDSSNSELSLPRNNHCEEHKVSYYNRLGYDFLWMTKELDSVLYYLFLCDQYAVLKSREVKEIQVEMTKKFRRTLSMITSWKPTGITREDLGQNTARVHQAFNKNADVGLSLEVIYLKLRADSAPYIDSHPNDKLDSSIEAMLKRYYK